MARRKIKTIEVINPKTGDIERWTAERKRLFEITYGVEVKRPEKPKENG